MTLSVKTPKCKVHKCDMRLRSKSHQTAEQKWCGAWYDCLEPSCNNSTLIPSKPLQELYKEHMATAQYPTKPDVGELIMSIPPHFIVDRDVVQEVIEFLSLFVKQKQR